MIWNIKNKNKKIVGALRRLVILEKNFLNVSQLKSSKSSPTACLIKVKELKPSRG